MSAEETLIGIALIFGLATACQVIAPKLNVPALLLLLPVGFLAGWLVPAVNAQVMLGEAFSPIVNIVVGIILFQGGLELGATQIHERDRKVLHRLVWIGGAITWLGALLIAKVTLQLSWELAILLGAVVIVSGPTVMTPLLKFARPKQRLRSLLMWESTLLDPIGALVAVVVFQAILSANGPTLFANLQTFVTSIAIAVVLAAIGMLAIRGGLLLTGDNRVLGTQVLLGTVVVTTAVADFFADDAGLVAALLLGMAVSTVSKRLKRDLSPVTPFFDTIVSIGIGGLFIAISALVTPASLQPVLLGAIVMAALLIVVVRPAMVLLLTIGSEMSMRERLFVAAVDPRGIVAAASASSFAAALLAAGVDGAEKILPATFLIIAVTVFVYGLATKPMTALLKVRN